MFDYVRTPVAAAVGAEETYGYGAQVWLWDRQGFPGVFGAHGYETQRLIMWPERDLLVVQLSKVPSASSSVVDRQLRRIIDSFLEEPSR